MVLEFIAFDDVLMIASDGDTIYTDCQRIVNLVTDKNPKFPYQSSTLERLNGRIIFVKPSREKNDEDRHFSEVDKMVRRHLRS